MREKQFLVPRVSQRVLSRERPMTGTPAPQLLPARGWGRALSCVAAGKSPPGVAAEGEAAPAPRGVAGPPKQRTVPWISVRAFCEDRTTAEVLQAAASDLLLAKARLEVRTGGLDAAVAGCTIGPVPDLIVVDTALPRALMLAGLDRLTAGCAAATKLIVIGRVNDVALYRELIERGIDEYLVAPVLPQEFIDAAANLFGHAGACSRGSIIAFIGAKGGVGSSTLCHNVAWTMSEILQSDVVLADLDLAFGTASLNFNQDPVQGIAEALQASARLDALLLDRFLAKCSPHLSILAAPVRLDERDYDISPDACDVLLDALRRYVPFVVVDLPHAWTPAVGQVLLQADEIVVTATPDLANLRNAKNLIDFLKLARRNGGAPRLVINMARTPKRPDIAVREFSAALDLSPAQAIEYDGEAFGLAANNGQMIEELSRKTKAAQQFRALALTLAHGTEPPVTPAVTKKPSPLAPILQKLRLTI